MKIENKTWKEAAKDWSNGLNVWSAELGGIGPGYEQAIQVLLWEILSQWDKEDLKYDESMKKYPEEYSEFVDKVTSDLDKNYGFSGAQVGAAKMTAFQFMVYGYENMMNKLDDNRWILVSKNFLGNV